MRRSPKSNTKLLSHLHTRTDDSKWLAVPRVLRPDHTARSFSGWDEFGWDEFGWDLQLRSPHINGRVVFLTGPRAASYAESLMGSVEHHRLGAIVGSATAGTNGNVAAIATPADCSVRFSGARVTKHDGSRQHLIGIEPTIPATRTIAGVLAGRDEVLERGLTYVRSAK
jgi:C-terminal processing protease CtpA/Prc